MEWRSPGAYNAEPKLYGSGCLQCREDEELHPWSDVPLQLGGSGYTYIVRGRDGNTVLERMPAHVQDLLVEVYLVCIRLFPHPSPLAPGPGRRAARSRIIFLARRPIGRACRRVDGRWYADLLSLESRFVGLQYHLHFLVRVRGVYHEVVVVTSSHYIFGVTGENDFEFVENAIVLVRVAQSRS